MRVIILQVSILSKIEIDGNKANVEIAVHEKNDVPVMLTADFQNCMAKVENGVAGDGEIGIKN